MRLIVFEIYHTNNKKKKLNFKIFISKEAY